MQFSSMNSPTSLSKSLAVVLGGGHSISCFLQRSLRNLLAASEVRSSAGGNLTLSAFSRVASIGTRLKGGVKSISTSSPTHQNNITIIGKEIVKRNRISDGVISE